jgi:hypothetical protein
LANWSPIVWGRIVGEVVMLGDFEAPRPVKRFYRAAPWR